MLSYQLHSAHKIKKSLVERKAYLIGKLYDCRVAAEKTDAKYKDKRTQNEQLAKQLAAKSDDYEKMSNSYKELQASYDSKTTELQKLQQSAVGTNMIFVKHL
jgi:chromosome segregation ATPase